MNLGFTENVDRQKLRGSLIFPWLVALLVLGNAPALLAQDMSFDLDEAETKTTDETAAEEAPDEGFEDEGDGAAGGDLFEELSDTGKEDDGLGEDDALPDLLEEAQQTAAEPLANAED